MNDKPRTPDKTPAPDRDFQRRLAAKQHRRLHRLRQSGYPAWFGLGMFGMVGWSVVIPTLLGIALGIWLDRAVTGRYSWTLLLLAVGIAVGCLNAWFWVDKERAAIDRERRDRENGGSR
jgi:ATP synthase protein I